MACPRPCMSGAQVGGITSRSTPTISCCSFLAQRTRWFSMRQMGMLWPTSRARSATTASMSYGVSETLHVGGPGGWDYLTVDPDHKLLFVPRSTHTMVLDAANGNEQQL